MAGPDGQVRAELTPLLAQRNPPILAGCAFAAPLLLAALLCGCESVVDGSKDKFSSEFTCPVDRVEATPKPELHPSDLGPKAEPPQDIAADPARLKMWQDKQTKATDSKDSRDDIIELSGCGHHVLYACHRYSKGFNRFMCSTVPLPASLVPALTLATLGKAPLTSSETHMTAPEIVGTYEAFDVVANYDWASSIAAAWSPDAKLYRLSAGPLTSDGKVDLGPRKPASVSYYFNSRAKGDVDLYLDVDPWGDLHSSGATVRLRAYSHGDSTARDPLPKPTCTLDRVLAALSSPRDAGVLDKAKVAGIHTDLHTIVGKPYWGFTYTDAAGKWAGVEVNGSTCVIEDPHGAH